MKLDERHLVQLAAVVQAGGVTEGAAVLGLSQPAISRTLAQLEKRLGEPLFVRGKRPLAPTPLGKALAEHGQIILSASRAASETIESFRRGTSGVVRAGGSPFFMDGLISRMIAGFQDRYPDVSVEQSYGYLSELRASLQAGRIDIAVCPVDVLDEGSGLEFREILPGRNVVACSSTHPLLMKRKPTSSDLLEYPWIAPPPGSPLLADLRSILHSLGVAEIKIRFSGGSLASVLNYMTASNALTVLPHSVVFAFRKGGQITALPINIPHPDRSLGLLCLTAAPRTPAVDTFADHIADAFADLGQLIKRHEQAIVWGA